MIRVYLIRHGVAVDQQDWPGRDDDSRPLTAKGRRRFRRAAAAFARLGEVVDKLVTSPLVRAVQTAELLASALRLGEVQISEHLRPGGEVEALLTEVATGLKDGQGLALVGHDPTMSRLLARVAELSREDAMRVSFRKGAIVRVDVGELPSARPAQARWWLRPKTRELRHGLPLAKDPATKARKKPASPAARKPPVAP